MNTYRLCQKENCNAVYQGGNGKESFSIFQNFAWGLCFSPRFFRFGGDAQAISNFSFLRINK